MDGRPFSRRHLSILLAGLALVAVPVMAGDDVWVVAGQPSGGQIFQVAVDPIHSSTLYALTNSGLFKSTDGGASWGFAYPVYGYNMAVDSVQPAKLYVANIDNGIWKSADGGTTWRNLTGISNAHLVVTDPVTEGVVYAIANGCDVYKSTNGGSTWVATGVSSLTGNANAYCTQIAVDPVNPQLLYLATQVGAFDGSTGMRDGSPLSGLYTSTDGGAHWTQNIATMGFADVVIDPNNDQNVYAGSYVSNNAGATWAPSATAPTDFTVIAVAPANSQVMWGVRYAGIDGDLWTSTDQGASWSQVSSMPYGNSVYNGAYDPSTPTTVYAASTAFGVLKSTDGGATWAESTAGLAGVLPFDILADSTGAIYMGTEGTGIFKSTDGGFTWAMKDAGVSVASGTSGIWVQDLVESSTEGALYFTGHVGSGLYKTTDGGDSWTPLTVSGGTGSINTLAVDPEQAQTVYVGTGGGQVMKSIDGGTTWNASSVSGLSTYGVWSLAVAPTDSKVLFAGGFGNGGLYKSTDGGATWAESDTHLPTAYGVWCIAVDPTTAKTVYACPGNAGIYKSTDGGATWSNAGDVGDSTFRILEIDPNDPNIIYTSIPGGPVNVSTDGGDTWTQLGDPPASSAAARRTEAVASPPEARSSSASQLVFMNSIAVDPRHAGHLYGAANTGQVYTLSVKGKTGGTTKPITPPASSGGGGDLSLLTGLLLLSFSAARRRR